MGRRPSYRFLVRGNLAGRMSAGVVDMAAIKFAVLPAPIRSGGIAQS